jgi:hypothetical protein
MPTQFPIADMHLFPLEHSEDGMLLLRNSDHLLRRFGQLDLISLEAGERRKNPAHEEADEIWFVLRGEIKVSMVDKRGGSPSEGKEVQLVIAEDDPHGLLLPFGVACMISSKKGASLLRVSTHSDREKEL